MGDEFGYEVPIPELTPEEFETLSKKRRMSPPVTAPSLEDFEDYEDYDETLLASAASAVAYATSTSHIALKNNVFTPFLNGEANKDVEEDINSLLNIADIPLP